MEVENKALQKIRKIEIPNTIDKYKKLVDGIFSQVSQPFPTFKDLSIKNEVEETVKSISAEEQLYNFMIMREKAIDHADRMLNKINMLEIEMYAPELLKPITKEEEPSTDNQPLKKRVRTAPK